ALETPGLHWNYYVAAGILALLAYVVWRHGADYPPRRRIGLFLVAAAFAYGYFKEGFVRHDVHATFFFGAVATAAVAFGTRSPARWLAVLAVALGAAAVLHTAHASLTSFFRPDKAARAYGFEARSLVQGGRRQALRARS